MVILEKIYMQHNPMYYGIPTRILWSINMQQAKKNYHPTLQWSQDSSRHSVEGLNFPIKQLQ